MQSLLNSIKYTSSIEPEDIKKNLKMKIIIASNSSGVSMICYNFILMLFILRVSIQIFGTKDWMTFLNPILCFNFMHSSMSLSAFGVLSDLTV